MTERWTVKGPHKHNLSYCLKDKDCVTIAAIIPENKNVCKCAYFSGKYKVKMEYKMIFGKVHTYFSFYIDFVFHHLN